MEALRTFTVTIEVDTNKRTERRVLTDPGLASKVLRKMANASDLETIIDTLLAVEVG